MIQIKDKKDCCGCNACVQRCPKQCITMQADGEGFLYPIVDTALCIDCGLCEKVCPVINQSEPRKPQKVYAAYNKNEEVRLQSSSGGIFTLLAEETIKKGGVVFGVKFNDDWMPEFGYTETIEGIAPFRGCKYVQAIVGNAYKEAEKFLKTGREVLFSGTPCQIAGLKQYLRKEYENLLAVDIICHGVPSPKVWDMYLKETCSKLLKTMPDGKKSVGSAIGGTYKSCIEAINFRSKITGWKKYSFLLKLNFSTCDGKNTGIFAETLDKNVFMRAFLNDTILRPSCYACPAKQGKGHSDITIADFWGINTIDPAFDDDKGCGLILVNTAKGANVYKCLNLVSKEKTFDEGIKYNSVYYRNAIPHPKRSKFFEKLDISPLEELSNKYIHKNNRIRNFLNKINMWNKIKGNKIIIDTPGQTCNRLWSYLDTIGWAITQNKKVYILFWDKDIKHFDKLRKNPYVSFPFYNKLLCKLFGDNLYYTIIKKIFANRFIHPIYSESTSPKYVKGWAMRAEKKYFPGVIDKIREIYTPNRYIINDVSPIIEKYKQDGYFIVGVHIRRGDYKTWEGGKYFFEHEEYAKHMDDIVKLYKDKNVCFVISTNERYNHSIYARFKICELNNTTAIHDLYALSLCDRIIGPLSTFSRWASFFGNVPLCFISKDMKIEKDEDFSVIESFYQFKNGNTIINLTDKK